MKYYLLTTNENWADEHDVPALACYNEKDYNKWLLLESGKLNSNYEKQMKIYKDNEKLSNDFWKALKKSGYINTEKIPKSDKQLNEMHDNYRKKYKYMQAPNKVFSGVYAHLGNSGEGFEENFSDYYLMKEFVDNGVVHVHEVSEDFYNTFKKLDLHTLSLTNMLDLDEKESYYSGNDED